MEERVYRQSRLCRLLGNPLAFAVVNVLGENKEPTPSEIARAIGRSVSRVSHVLAALRLAELVRYETETGALPFETPSRNPAASPGASEIHRFFPGFPMTVADLRN
jgi:hypothetical protein